MFEDTEPAQGCLIYDSSTYTSADDKESFGLLPDARSWNGKRDNIGYFNRLAAKGKSGAVQWPGQVKYVDL
jgi:hypothetical protein